MKNYCEGVGMTNVQDSANQWLASLDTDDFSACWNSAADYFKQGIPLDEWTDKAQSVRDGVGQMQSRNLKRAIETTDLPAAPEGTYVVSEYGTVFSKAGEIGERLTMVREEDGQMRVVGYYLI